MIPLPPSSALVHLHALKMYKTESVPSDRASKITTAKMANRRTWCNAREEQSRIIQNTEKVKRLLCFYFCRTCRIRLRRLVVRSLDTAENGR